jgi:hypothetical protein
LCYWLYYLEGGGCKLNTTFLISVAVAILVCFVAFVAFAPTAPSNTTAAMERARAAAAAAALASVPLTTTTAAQNRPRQFFRQESHENFIAAGDTATGAASTIGAGTVPRLQLPSGVWRGYYNIGGTQHDVCQFELQFSDTGKLT